MIRSPVWSAPGPSAPEGFHGEVLEVRGEDDRESRHKRIGKIRFPLPWWPPEQLRQPIEQPEAKSQTYDKDRAECKEDESDKNPVALGGTTRRGCKALEKFVIALV